MPYPAGHKEKVKARIMNSAGAEFRLNGIQATSIPQVMKGAKLTHGGFYAYFSNKEQLVSETCSKIVDDTLALLLQLAEEHKNESGIEAVIDFYLSTTHREDVKGGCMFPILTSEASRANDEIRQVYGRELERFVQLVSDLSGKDMATSSAAVSLMVGSLMLARATDHFSVSNRILQAGREHAKQMLLS